MGGGGGGERGHGGVVVGPQEGGGGRVLGTIVGEKWQYGLVSKLNKVRVGGSVEGGEQPGRTPLPAPPHRSPSDHVTLEPIHLQV